MNKIKEKSKRESFTKLTTSKSWNVSLVLLSSRRSGKCLRSCWCPWYNTLIVDRERKNRNIFELNHRLVYYFIIVMAKGKKKKATIKSMLIDVQCNDKTAIIFFLLEYNRRNWHEIIEEKEVRIELVLPEE